jgi:hypothetical protein
MSIRLRLLVLLAITSSSALAAAEPATPTPSASATTEARERFQRGVTLYREGSFDAALAEFKRAYEIAPNYRILYNLAQVQVERHDSVAALNLFGQYLQQGGSEIESDRRAQVERDMQSLRGRVADLTIESNVSGAQLTIDGIEAGTLPLAGAIQVNSGVRQVTVSKPGYQSVSKSVTIAGAQPLKLTLTLQPLDGRPVGGGAAAATKAPSEKGAEQSHGLSAPFWVSAVATGLFTGAAVTFGVVSMNKNQKLDDELNKPGNEPAIEDARSSLKTTALLTDVFTGAAIVGAATTVYFAVTSGSSSEAAAKAARRKDGLQVGATGSQLILSGRF